MDGLATRDRLLERALALDEIHCLGDMDLE